MAIDKTYKEIFQNIKKAISEINLSYLKLLYSIDEFFYWLISIKKLMDINLSLKLIMMNLNLNMHRKRIEQVV